MTEQIKAGIQSQLPIGTNRQKVEDYIDTHDLWHGVYTFDYPPDDPRQGTLIAGAVGPALPVRLIQDRLSFHAYPDLYFTFYFNHEGSDGKLVRSQLSNSPIPIPPP